LDGKTTFKAVGFDLDNTLYNQSDHMTAFVSQASQWLSERTAVSQERAERVFLEKLNELTSYHTNLFDKVLESLNIPNHGLVRELVAQYHNFQPALKLFPDSESVLQRIAAKNQLFMITDGNFKMQEWKVRALRIADYFSIIIYTGRFGPEWTKPSILPFRYAAASLGRAPGECVYIGDNPLCDFRGAREAGLSTIRVLTGPFAECVPAEEQMPDYTVDSIAAIEDVL